MDPKQLRELLHDLNQPLCSILMNAKAASQFLKGKVLDITEIRNIVSDIEAEAQRASDLSKAIRELIKQEEKQTT